jgi:hypothetical protein
VGANAFLMEDDRRPDERTAMSKTEFPLAKVGNGRQTRQKSLAAVTMISAS